jgi:GNAT superfamily N-acetyltransferase
MKTKGDCSDTHLPRYTIGRARRRDLAALPSIERAAARLLSGHAPQSVLAETTSAPELEHAWRQGLLWVARHGDFTVGFAHVVVHPHGVAHLQELDVLPAHGRRGLGRRLVVAVCRWARARRMNAVTLTTFRELPWNMPFYATLGFEEVPSSALSRTLRRILRDESRRGLVRAQRAAMRRIVNSTDA